MRVLLTLALLLAIISPAQSRERQPEPETTRVIGRDSDTIQTSLIQYFANYTVGGNYCNIAQQANNMIEFACPLQGNPYELHYKFQIMPIGDKSRVTGTKYGVNGAALYNKSSWSYALGMDYILPLNRRKDKEDLAGILNYIDFL